MVRNPLFWVSIVGAIVAGLLAGLLLAVFRGWLDESLAQMILSSALVLSSIAVAAFAVVAILESRETALRPAISLDLVRQDGSTIGGAIRVLNCGTGPAVDIQFKIVSEPGVARFKVSDLPALKNGLPTLPAGESRVYGTGQPYDELAAQEDGRYRIRVRYRSLGKRPYKGTFDVFPEGDYHLLRSSIPTHSVR